MPMRNSWLPREGFTSDVVGSIIKNTVLNPSLTLPLILLARFTKRGEDLAILHETGYSRLKFLFYLGLARWANAYFSAGALNNWTKDEFVWEKEIAVVTGGAGGIGSHIVRLLAEHKVQVAVLDVVPITFDAPSNVHYFKCDITSTAAVAAVAKEIRNTIGVPTILVNNAGVASGKTIFDSSEKDIRATFGVNTIAHYILAKEFVPAMAARNHGIVVTVASIAAYITVSNMVDYSASKAAALCFSEGLATELKTRYNAPKVRTIVVNPGYTDTPLFRGYDNPSRFLAPTLNPETVAEEVVKKILSGTSGQIIVPGFTSFLAFLKGFPHWYQIRTRTDAQKAIKAGLSKQVMDDEKDTFNGSGGESASTVFVSASEK